MLASQIYAPKLSGSRSRSSNFGSRSILATAAVLGNSGKRCKLDDFRPISSVASPTNIFIQCFNAIFQNMLQPLVKIMEESSGKDEPPDMDIIWKEIYERRWKIIVVACSIIQRQLLQKYIEWYCIKPQFDEVVFQGEKVLDKFVKDLYPSLVRKVKRGALQGNDCFLKPAMTAYRCLAIYNLTFPFNDMLWDMYAEIYTEISRYFRPALQSQPSRYLRRFKKFIRTNSQRFVVYSAAYMMAPIGCGLGYLIGGVVPYPLSYIFTPARLGFYTKELFYITVITIGGAMVPNLYSPPTFEIEEVTSSAQ